METGSHSRHSLLLELRTNERGDRSLLGLAIRRMANWVRSRLYLVLRCRYAKRGGLLRIPWSVSIWAPHKIVEFGDRVQFGRGCLIQCDIRFGNDVLVANNVAFIGRNEHRIDVPGALIWDSPRGPDLTTVIEDDVWIGHGSIILSGVRIGRGSVVAAGSVVVKDVEAYSVVAGVPAVLVKQRFTAEEIVEHEAVLPPRQFY